MSTTVLEDSLADDLISEFDRSTDLDAVLWCTVHHDRHATHALVHPGCEQFVCQVCALSVIAWLNQAKAYTASGKATGMVHCIACHQSFALSLARVVPL